MPTKPNGNITLAADNVQILNTVRANSSPLYQDRIPLATRENFAQVGNSLLEFSPSMNEFLPELLNRIALTVISSKNYNNSLRMFKKGMLGYGEDVNEIFVSLARAHQYNPAVAEKTLFKREIPDVSSVFHRVNYKNFWKVTIQWEELRMAFNSQYGLQQLTQKIIDSLYSSEQFDEFVIMKEQIVNAVNNGRMRTVQVPAGNDKETLDEVAIAIRAMSNMWVFMDNSYNELGVLTYTPKDEQYLILDAAFAARFDVQELAAAFNMDKVEFLGHQILIDNFSTLTPQGAIAAMVSRDWFMDFDKERVFKAVENGEGLYWNYNYHAWKIFSTSPFANAVLFTTAPSTVTGITISGADSVQPGKNVQFTASIAGTGTPFKGVEWTVSEPTNSYITNQGLLVVGQFERAATLTVTATAIGNRSIQATQTVTITA